MEMLSYGIPVAILMGVLAVLLIPVSVRFDSSQKSLTVVWMGLSWSKRLSREKLRRPGQRPEKEKWLTPGRVFRCMLKDGHLALELLQKLHRPLMHLLRSVSIRKIEASFSTPDPMWNGVLYGVIANIHRENVKLSVNFQEINYLRACLQVQPYRVLNTAIALVLRLPCRRIIRAIVDIKKEERKEESS